MNKFLKNLKQITINFKKANTHAFILSVIQNWIYRLQYAYFKIDPANFYLRKK